MYVGIQYISAHNICITYDYDFKRRWNYTYTIAVQRQLYR